MSIPGPPPPGAPGPYQDRQGPQGPQGPQWGSRRHQGHPGAGSPPPPPTAAVKPGIVSLAPLNLGSILGGAFTVFRFHPRAMLILPLVLFAILGAIATPLVYLLAVGLENAATASTIVLQVAPAGLALLGISLASLAITPFLAGAVHEAVLGRKLPVGEIWRTTRGRIPAILAYTVLIGLATTVPLGLLVLPILLLDDITAIVVAVLVLGLGYLVLWVWLGTKLLLTPVCIVLESLGPIAAARRSFQLTRGAFWPILGTYLLASLIASAVQQVLGFLSLPLSVVAGVVWGDRPELMVAISTPLGVLSAAVALPFTYAVITLIQIDRRIKLEAYDVVLAQQAVLPDGTLAPTARAAGAPPPPPPSWGNPPATGPDPYGVWDSSRSDAAPPGQPPQGWDRRG